MLQSERLNNFFIAAISRGLKIYITGSTALKLFMIGNGLNPEWEPQNIDLLGEADKSNVIRSLVRHKFRTFVYDSSQSLFAAGMNAETFTSLDVNFILTRSRADSLEDFMDDNFDLDICRIAYQVIPYEPVKSARTLVYSIALRYPRVPKDIRKMLFHVFLSFSSTELPIWCFSDFPLLGKTFNRCAALQEKEAFAVHKWKPPLYSRGRAEKYEKRGFLIAEYPTRMSQDTVDLIVEKERMF